MEKSGKATGEHRWDGRNRFLGGPHQMAENRTQDGRFKCQFEKKEVLQFFSQLNQVFSFGIVLWDSKLIRHGNWDKLGPF